MGITLECVENCKKTVCLDFDGVVYSYESGWQDEAYYLPDPPVQNTRWAVARLREDFKVVIHSTRSSTEKGRKAIAEWLKKHDIVVDDIVEHKPVAFIYVDDRGLKFDGNWSRSVFEIIGYISYMDYGKGRAGGILNKPEKKK